jgi:hypothetical protein
LTQCAAVTSHFVLRILDKMFKKNILFKEEEECNLHRIDLDYSEELAMDDYVAQLVDHQQYDLKSLDNIDLDWSMLDHIQRIMNFEYLLVFLMAKRLVLLKSEVY